MNDLWAFNLQSHIWKQINPADEVIPEIRSGHSSCVYQDLILIFGGIFEVTRELNDVYGFSLSQKRWVPLSEDHNSPLKLKKAVINNSLLTVKEAGTPLPSGSPYRDLNSAVTDVIATDKK